MNAKIKRICAQLKKEHLDGLILSSPANISYLADYPSRDSYLIISDHQSVYLTDSRYTEEAKSRLKGIAVKDVSSNPLKGINQVCRQLRLKSLGFEKRNLSFMQYNKIRKELSDILDLVPTDGLVESLRQLKSENEVKKIKQATRIAVQAFRFIRDYLKPGIKEIEIAGELERFIRYHGASGASFNIIVASGPNSAFAHHITSERKLKENEPVLVDFGVDYRHYKSDLTRVFFLGKINVLAGKVYQIVRQAQKLAIKAIKPGKTCGEIDGIARGYIESKGYGGFFGHGLGHGVGLEVHEEPRIGRNQNTRLEPGMVFTVEPAIYLPKKFGIRLEDIVLVTKKGSEVLSGALNK